MYYIIDIVKALACLLIANFHSDILFPDSLSLLAFGGDVGNNIFFMVSGFTLLPSVEECNSQNIGGWYCKRVMRLLPMLLFFYLLTWGTGGVAICGFKSFINAFVFPTIYWFTGAILVFYFVFFIYVKYLNSNVHIGSIILLMVLHLCWDNLSAEIYFIGFISMLAGAWIRKNFESLTENAQTKKMLPLTLLTGFLYVALKLLRGKGIEVLGVIHLGIGILTIFLSMEIIVWGGTYEDSLKAFFEKHTISHCIIHKLSMVTLALYLLMGLNNRIIMRSVKECFLFPFSYMVNMAISLFCAYIITVIDKKFHELKNNYS